MSIALVSDILREGRPSLSFEVFPPKQAEQAEAVSRAALEIAALHPSFMSVTYGAGGTTDRYTLRVSQVIQAVHGVPALAHMTCVGAGREQVQTHLAALQSAGIHNVMALRGDIPEGYPAGHPVGVENAQREYPYAKDLIAEIKAYGGFCVGAACYPEGHVECDSPALDRQRLKQKVDAGVDFLTTQMFFDNALLYKFLYQIREIGVSVPIVAGIMPVTNGRQIARICKLSGTWLPAKFRAIVDKYGSQPEAMRQAGILYACTQIIDLLANGVTAVHVYSMNKPDVAAAIHQNLKHVIGGDV